MVCGQLLAAPENETPEYFYKKFLIEAKKHGVEIKDKTEIIFVKQTPLADSIAVCTNTFENGKILVLKEHWDTLGYFQKEILIFHELGHCVLHLPHNEEIKRHKFVSIMSHWILSLSEAIYVEYREYYLNELFNPLKEKK